MEATINPLLATTTQNQASFSIHAADLFSIDSANLKAVPKEDSFSSFLQERVEEQRQAKRQERKQLPDSGKENAAVEKERREQALKAEAEAEAKEQRNLSKELESRSTEVDPKQEQMAKERQDQGTSAAEEQAKKDSAEAEQGATEEEEKPSEEETAETVPEPLLVQEEVVVQAEQSGEAERQLHGLAAAAERVEEPTEDLELESDIVVDEALLERAARKRSSQDMGREKAPPPELKLDEQPRRPGEELDLKMAMQAARQQANAATGQIGTSTEMSGSAQGGAQAASATGNASLEAMQPTTERSNQTNQIKGMTVPPQSRQWSSELGDRILFMANQKLQAAEIRLNPPNLGLLEVKLAISGDQAQLVFQSGNANVREVLESAVPRIREMLEQNGINLADVNISDGKPQSEEGGERQRASAGGLSGLGQGVEEEVVPISAMAVDRIGLVDYYI